MNSELVLKAEKKLADRLNKNNNNNKDKFMSLLLSGQLCQSLSWERRKRDWK